jgi:hypothetical protein
MKPFDLARLGRAGAATLVMLSATLGTLAFAQQSPKRIALLVGVGDYKHPELNLEGPPNDVAALRDVLMRRWGFKAQDIKTLVDDQATRANILGELAALSRRSAANDEVLVYFSGHGTSALDANLKAQMNIPLPHGSGAFVPVDFKPEAGANGLIVGRSDLVPVFSGLEAAGRRLWVISDSCYSGQQVRSVQIGNADELPVRMMPQLAGKVAVAHRADLALAEEAPALDPYPYRATGFLSASTEGERARDIPKRMLARNPTLDGKPHGAMTDALLRVMEGQIPSDFDGDGMLSLNEVHRATSDFMAQRAYGHSPMRLPAVSEDLQGLGNRPVLSVRGVALPSKNQALKPLRVRFDGVPDSLRAAVAGVPDSQIVTDAALADIVLLVSQQAPDRLGVIAASGDLLAGMPVTDTARAAAQVMQLAWAQRLRGLAEKHRRGALQVDLDPAANGGNFVPGKKISFVVKPDKKATLVLLNINSEGKVGVLYPYMPAEAQPIDAGQARHIPGTGDQRITVTEPFGMDMQFVFAFDEPPPGLAGLHRLDGATPDNPRLQAFERGLTAMAGKFTFATSNLRTLKP